MTQHDSERWREIQPTPVACARKRYHGRVDGYLGLGSNLGDRGGNLRAGLAGLEAAGVDTVAVSSIWETEPVDADSPLWFWNMAVEIRTERSPLELLDLLLKIERWAGRRRASRNAPRTLDMDLLLLGQLNVNHARLRLPHPRMWSRSFVLEPLAEIAPHLLNPETGRSVADERARLTGSFVVRRLGRLASAGSVLL